MRSKPLAGGGLTHIKRILSTHRRNKSPSQSAFKLSGEPGEATNSAHGGPACLHLGETLSTVWQARSGSRSIACLNLGHIGGNDPSGKGSGHFSNTPGDRSTEPPFCIEAIVGFLLALLFFGVFLTSPFPGFLLVSLNGPVWL